MEVMRGSVNSGAIMYGVCTLGTLVYRIRQRYIDEENGGEDK